MQRWVAYYDLQTVSPRSGSEIFNFNNQYFIIDGHSFGKLNHEMSGFRCSWQFSNPPSLLVDRVNP